MQTLLFPQTAGADLTAALHLLQSHIFSQHAGMTRQHYSTHSGMHRCMARTVTSHGWKHAVEKGLTLLQTRVCSNCADLEPLWRDAACEAISANLLNIRDLLQQKKKKVLVWNKSTVKFTGVVKDRVYCCRKLFVCALNRSQLVISKGEKTRLPIEYYATLWNVFLAFGDLWRRKKSKQYGWKNSIKLLTGS